MAQFLNMHKVELSNGVAPVVSLRQIFYGDVDANRIGAIVQMNGAPVALGGTCSGTAILADGSTVALTGTVSGNEAYVVLPAGCYSVEGQIQVFVKITVSGVTTTLLAAVGTVRLTETDQIIDPGTIIPSVSALITSIEDAIASIPADYSALLSSIAPAFSTGADYAAGDYVRYNGTLYRFTANHAAGSWTGTDAAAAVIGNDLTALKSAFDEFALAAEPITLSGGYTIFINTSDQWSTSGSPKSNILPLPANVEYVRITANSVYSSTIAFLKTNGHTSGQTPDYATGSGRTSISIGETGTFRIPNDANYIYIFKTRNGDDFAPQTAEYLIFKEIVSVDTTLSTSGDAADAKTVGDAIGGINSDLQEINNALTERVDVDLTASGFSQIINSSNEWSIVSSNRKCWITYVVDDAKRLTVKASMDEPATIAFLKTNAHTVGTAPDYATGTGRIILAEGETQTFNVPEDAKFLYVLNYYQTDQYAPESAVWIRQRKFDAVSIPLGLHEMPRSISALNIVKRARQITDIKWTPAVDLKRYMSVARGVTGESIVSQQYLGIFKAGVEYTGIPYGRSSQTMSDYGYNYATPGNYIDLETFVTSVSNPKSKLCSENVGSVSGHRSVIYSTVCSGLVSYALNVSEVPTASIPSISGLTLIGKLNDNGTLLDDDEFMIGDVLNLYDYHTGIITDIIREEDGKTIKFIEVSDATSGGLADRNYSDGLIGGIARRKGYSRAQLFDHIHWGQYSLYRYTKEVPYIPNHYVNVGDEFNDWRIEHFPAMPYEGNGFVYKTGYIPNNAVKIIISLDGYAYLRVLKDGTEITGSPFAVPSGTESINVTEITSGEYSAYLCNITDGQDINVTYPCRWTIE